VQTENIEEKKTVEKEMKAVQFYSILFYSIYLSFSTYNRSTLEIHVACHPAIVETI
jgi:hypothetical protein